MMENSFNGLFKSNNKDIFKIAIASNDYRNGLYNSTTIEVDYELPIVGSIQ